MTMPRSTLSKLRETLKQEDDALSERLPAVAVPPAIRAKARSGSARAGKSVAARKVASSAAASKAVPKPESTPGPANLAQPEPPRAKAGSERPAEVLAIEDKKAKSGRAKLAKPEKVERDSFSMPAGEHKRIKALRAALAEAGCEASKSEVLRAGLALLAARDVHEVARIVAALPKVPKGRRGKKA